MFNCPFCTVELNDDMLSSGRCPQCGGMVKWDEPTVAPPAQSGEINNPPPTNGDQQPASPDFGRDRNEPAATPVTPQVSAEPGMTVAADEQWEPLREAHDAASDSADTAEVNAATILSPRGKSRDEGGVGRTIRRDADTRRSFRLRTMREDDADVQQLKQIWHGTYTPDSRPGMTIKGGGVQSEDAARSVVIKPRVVTRPGEVTFGAPDYELLNVIGEGGVGVVYAARQNAISRTVAVKMLRPYAAADYDARDKFLSEAVVTGELDHPNIVPIYDLGTDESGAMFYSMKRVEGTPWLAVMKDKRQSENLDILMKVADAVAFAHARGVVHRDLKPENIMLGNYGEVLVMDWGIALSTSMYLRQGVVTQSNSMGGTPAYMAPEMATGPLDRIGPPSDVYLLGAILFECITGEPPHNGHDVLSCLQAAARNEIQPTDQEGELLEIAYKAMATRPEDRYESVHAFQDAIRTYQSHYESIALAARAEQDVQNARVSKSYQDYARAVFAYQEALSLWPQNSRAWDGLEEVQLAYAQTALEKGDFDLGLSLLDGERPAHRNLHRRLLAAQHERDVRQMRLKNIRRTAQALAVAIILTLSVGFVYIQNQKRDLDATNIKLSRNEKTLIAKQEELTANEISLNKTVARLNEQTDELARKGEALADSISQLAVAKQRADDEAQLARRQEERAEHTSYVARIGLAAAQIDKNAFLDAFQAIREFDEAGRTRWRHWEWGRLKFLCERAAHKADTGTRVQCVDWSADGRWLLAGTASGEILLHNAETLEALAPIQLDGPASCAALSPDGRFVVTAAAGSGGVIQVWPVQDTEPQGARRPLAELAGHGDDVVSLTFSDDQRFLVSTSRDQTAIVWNFDQRRQQQVLRGHFGPVWDAAISADNRQVYTAGDDRTVGIWDVASGQRIKRFRGHQGRVLTVAVTHHSSPEQRMVLSAGEDRMVLGWHPQTITEFDYQQLQRRLTQVSLRQPAEQSSQSEGKIRVFAGHWAEVHSLAVSRDNRFVASSGHDNTVRIWDLNATEDQSAYRVLRGHGGWVRSVAFAPDGQRVLSGGFDRHWMLWDVETYAEYIDFRGHDDAVLDATFVPDGSSVMTTGRDRKAILWDARTGQTQYVFEEGHDFLTSMAAFFPPGDDRFATSAGDGSTIVWHMSTGSQLMRLAGTGQNSLVAVSPDAAWVLTGGQGTDALAWNVTEQDKPAAQRLEGHFAPVTAIATGYGPDGRSIWACSGDAQGQAILWRLEDATGRWRAEARLNGHVSGFAISAIRFLPDGQGIVTSSADQTLREWSIEPPVEIQSKRRRLEAAIKSFDLSPDGQRAVVVQITPARVHVLQHWDLQHGQLLHEHPLKDQTAFSVAVSSDGQAALVATNDPDNTLWRWDLASGQYERFWKTHDLPGAVWSAFYVPQKPRIMTVGGNSARLWDDETGERVQSFTSHRQINSLSLTAHGRRAATAGSEGSIKIWDVQEQRGIVQLPARHLIEGRARAVHAVAYSPRPHAAVEPGQQVFDETDLLVSAGDDGTVRFWWIDGESFREGHVIHVAPAIARSVAFSPDGRWLVLGGTDGVARIFDAATGKAVRTLEHADGHRLAINDVVWSSDGLWIGTGSDDNMALIWEAHTGHLASRLTGHTAAITALDIAPDSRRIVTASKDGTAKLWDSQTGDEILTLSAHTSELTAARFSPDGRLVLTAGLDGRAIVWLSDDVPPSIALGRDPLVVSQPGELLAVDELVEFSDPDQVQLQGAELRVEIQGDSQAGLKETLEIRPSDGVAWSIRRDGEDMLVFDNNQPDAAPSRVQLERPASNQLRLHVAEPLGPRALEALLRCLHYSAQWETVPDVERQIVIKFTDPQGVSAHEARRVIRFQNSEVLTAALPVAGPELGAPE